MKVWNYATGYVKISIMGDYPERTVNRALDSGIPVYEAEFTSPRTLVCCVPMRCFRALRSCARGGSCRVRIIKKHGLPLLLIKVRYGLPLAAGALAAAAALIFGLSRLWLIDIDYGGADPSAIRQAIAEAGVGVGVPVDKVEPSLIDSKLGALEGVVSSQTVRHGVCLSVSVYSKDALDRVGNASFERGVPSSIYADRDCVISSVSVVSGIAAVREGQSVKKGQLLISGDMTALKEGYRVASEGEIYGRLLYRAAASADRFRKTYRPDGRETTVTAFVLFGKEYLFDMPYEAYELYPLEEAGLDACALPFMVRRYRCVGLAAVSSDIGDEAARLLAAEEARGKLFDSIPNDARIVSVHTDLASDDTGATASVTAVTVERIGYRREIDSIDGNG